MASPLYDALSIQHSRNIGDAVAAAGTNGSTFSTTQRDNHLNNAIRRLIRNVVAINRPRAMRGLKTNYEPIQAYIVDSPQVALVANAISLTAAGFTGGEIDEVLSVINATSNKFIKPVPPNMSYFVHSNIAVNSFLTASSTNQFWYVQGGNLTVTGSGATDNIEVKYVKRHTALTAAFASDILITSPYWNILLDYALVEALQDRPNDKNVVRAKQMIETQQARMAQAYNG